MTDTWREAYERSERNNRELQGRILAVPGTERVLRKLKKAGANREKILSLLADAVLDTTFWLVPVRRQKRALENLANQLETLANHAEKISLDPGSYGTFWLAILGIGEWENVKPAHVRAPTYIFGFMRLYAKNCRERARAFGSLLRDYPPQQQRAMADCIMLEVWLGTGKYHDKEIAFLLTNSYEAIGQEREVTEDQIKKHRQRYVMPRIKAYLLSHPRTSAPDSEKGTVRTP